MSKTKINNVVRVGIDTAKSVFALHGVDKYGKKCFVKTLSRKKLLAFTANLQPCLIAMESCGGNHYWAKEFNKQGHDARLIAACHVKPYVSSNNKDDTVDAEAICEAAGRPKMKFVPIKSNEQLEIQALHRHRQQLTKLATQLSNQMRGLLLEHGIVIPKGIHYISQRIPLIVEDAEYNLSGFMRDLINDIYIQFTDSKKSLEKIDKRIEEFCKNHSLCKKACEVPGIGPITATALYAAIGNGKQFKNGRGLAQWLGLIPSHKGSGGRNKNGRLSKKGNRYVKTLAIQGGRSVVLASKRKVDPYSKRIQEMEKRKGHNMTAIACAHKSIKIAWVLMSKDEEYKKAA